MKNFGPYKGELKIEFKSVKGKNLWVIWGKNGAGKTHILQALVWCLYGCDPTQSKKKQYGTEKDSWEFIYGAHLKDRPIDDPYMYVNLYLEEDTNDVDKVTQYLIKRSITPLSLSPINSTQIHMDFEIIKDGRRSDSPREEVESLLPLAASQFFMFHGEQIREMSQKHADETHQAIELILEAETFRKGKGDLIAVAKEIEDDLDDERRRSGNMGDLLDVKKNTQERIDELILEVDKSKEEVVNKKRELASTEALLQQNESSQVLQERLTSFQNREHENKEQKEKILSQRDDLINDLPAKMILPELKRIEKQKEVIHQKRQEQEEFISELKGRLKLISEMEKIDSCKVCGRKITQAECEHMKNEEELLTRQISGIKANLVAEDPSYTDIRETVRVIERSKLNFEQFKIDLANNALAKDEIKVQIDNIRKQLTESKSQEVRALMVRRDSLLMQIGAAEKTRDNYQTQLDNQKKALENVNRLIEEKDKHSNIKKSLESQQVLAEKCVTAFESVLNNLSDVRRNSIALNATEIFKSLTNKPDEYDRIEIDETFNVSVMDKNNNVVQRGALSTGERLVVALSFILGLKQASEKTAPLVLDTFFDHLDDEHFGNIIKALPKFADQVVLILTKLEYKNLKEMAPESFFDHISQTLHVVRNKVELRSQILEEA
jgi:DNA sulfur modification protein DndD